MKDERGRFSLKFDVDKHEIDAASYGAILVNTVALVDEITNELEGFGKFEIKVVAERKSSYLTDLSMQAGTIVGITSSMLTPENILAAKAFASKVVSYLGKGLELIKKLGGDPPKSISQKGDKAVIVTGDGNTINVDNSITNVFLDNPRGQSAVSNIFSNLADQPEINGIEILDEKKNAIFESTKADFPKLAAKFTKKEVKRRTRTIKATLTPLRQSFDPKRKSDFLYRGNSITAEIEDEKFWKRVEADEAFAKSDKLVVKLKINEEFLEDFDAYKIKSYVVAELLDHKAKQPQPSLFDGASDGKRIDKPMNKKPGKSRKR